MKTSELIKRLQELMEKHGDVDCTWASGCAEIEPDHVYFTDDRVDGKGVIVLTD